MEGKESPKILCSECAQRHHSTIQRVIDGYITKVGERNEGLLETTLCRANHTSVQDVATGGGILVNVHVHHD